MNQMEEKRLTPIKAIRAKCLECSCGNVNEVKLCVIPDCPLYPYRLGHNPYIKVSEERKAVNAANLQKINEERRRLKAQQGKEV